MGTKEKDAQADSKEVEELELKGYKDGILMYGHKLPDDISTAEDDSMTEDADSDTESYEYYQDDNEYGYDDGIDYRMDLGDEKKSDFTKALQFLCVLLLIVSCASLLSFVWFYTHKVFSPDVSRALNGDYTVISYEGVVSGYQASGTTFEVKVNNSTTSYRVAFSDVYYTDIEALFEHDGENSGMVLYKYDNSSEERYALYIYKKQG